MSKKQEEILKESRQPFAKSTKPHRNKKKYSRKTKQDKKR